MLWMLLLVFIMSRSCSRSKLSIYWLISIIGLKSPVQTTAPSWAFGGCTWKLAQCWLLYDFSSQREDLIIRVVLLVRSRSGCLLFALAPIFSPNIQPWHFENVNDVYCTVYRSSWALAPHTQTVHHISSHYWAAWFFNYFLKSKNSCSFVFVTSVLNGGHVYMSDIGFFFYKNVNLI